MAYNPAMYNTYGNLYGTPYGNNFSQQAVPVQQQPQSFGQQMPVKGTIEWVDGEVGAKAYQIPAGMTTPIALWDTNDCVIYLKSMNPMGMPNPLQKIHYKMEETAPKYMGQSGTQNLTSGEPEKPDMTQYVRKEDLQRMKDELVQSLREMNQETAVPAKHGAKGE